jgi:hypothetical protein
MAHLMAVRCVQRAHLGSWTFRGCRVSERVQDKLRKWIEKALVINEPIYSNRKLGSIQARCVQKVRARACVRACVVDRGARRHGGVVHLGALAQRRVIRGGQITHEDWMYEFRVECQRALPR